MLSFAHMKQSTYLDYAASTPLDPRAGEAMMRALAAVGNPSSVHAQGRTVRAFVETAREQVAALVGTPASSVTFTSGATEANALAVRGAIMAAHKAVPGAMPRILCGPTEHSSIMATVRAIEQEGLAAVTWLPVDRDGVVDAEEVLKALGDDVALVVMQWANNVTGVLQPVAKVGMAVMAERARRTKGALPIAFLCDAVQAARTQELRPLAIGIDFLTLSAHKLYGPKGVGALIRRPGALLVPSALGGGQEDGLRSGTENVSGIAGFGAAAAVCLQEKQKDALHAVALRSALLEGLAGTALSPLVSAQTVPDIVYLIGKNLGDRAVFALDDQGIAVSSGSACDAGKHAPSHVIAAMGRAGTNGVRLSFGRGTGEGDITDAVAALKVPHR